MTLQSAIDAITAEFPLDKTATPDDTCEITSGGERKDRDKEPALFISQNSAIAAWQREALAWLRDAKPTAIQFLDGPHLDRWYITVMDSKRTHRVAEDRYSVTAKMGVVRALSEAVPPAVREKAA